MTQFEGEASFKEEAISRKDENKFALDEVNLL